jgi:hypothetical protein
MADGAGPASAAGSERTAGYVDGGRFNEPIQPMTLGKIQANGFHSLAVSCHKCHHEVVINVDGGGDDLIVALFGPRMVCKRCGTVGGEANDAEGPE